LLLGAHDFGGTTPCRLAPNKHTYFTISQIVESAFRTSWWPSFHLDFYFQWFNEDSTI